MKNIIITIGREYGSGGKYIGSEVARKLNIPFYDKELINKAHEKNGCNYSKLEEYDEVNKNTILNTINTYNFNNYYDIFNNEIYQSLMDKTIKDISENTSCVILGRNSNNILKNKNNVINIFIYSNDLEFKIKRKMKNENITYDAALKRLKYIDKQRKRYYESLNKGHVWGSRDEYDYLIDSSRLGIDKTIELIIDIYNKFNELNS